MSKAPSPPAGGPLVVLVPVLGRPHRVEPLLASVAAGCPPGTHVVFIADPADAEERAAVMEQASEGRVSLLVFEGNYAAKVNMAVRESTEPLLFIGADDLHFHPGWFEAATAKLTDGVGVVGTNDLGSPRVIAGEHATHFLMTRAYAELPTTDGGNGPLCERYDHNCVDDELIGTAKHRGAYAHAADAHVEHLHPDWGKGERDDVYRKGRRHFHRDLRLRDRRRALWT